jgi:hypothetical protein
VIIFFPFFILTWFHSVNLEFANEIVRAEKPKKIINYNEC